MAKNVRINDRIRSQTVRLVNEKGEQVGVMSIQDALSAAAQAGLDLVEVAPNGTPPVCKIMDYGKFKYGQKKKMHGNRPKQHIVHVKEIRLRPKTDRHDMEFKIRHAERFLHAGDKVLVNVLFRGREMAHIDRGRQLLTVFAQELEHLANIENQPKMEGRRMTMMLAAKPRPQAKAKRKPERKPEPEPGPEPAKEEPPPAADGPPAEDTE